MSTGPGFTQSQDRATYLADAFITSIRQSRELLSPNTLLRWKDRGPFVREFDEIDSVSALAEYLSVIPEPPHAVDFDGVEEVVRKLLLGREVTSYFVGGGLSFSVHATKRNALPDDVVSDWPEQLQEEYANSAHRLVAHKRPIIDVVDGVVSAEQEAKAISAIAWEHHVLHHPPVSSSENIVKLYGVTWEQIYVARTKQILLPVLVMEFAGQGSLNDLLNADSFDLHFGVKKKLCLDVARGLAVLHDNRIVHGDVKTENVLLFRGQDGSLTAKVSDFGCSVHIPLQTSGEDPIVCIRGHSPPWDAPETLADQIHASGLSLVDIYCWGLLFWKVMLDGRTGLDYDSTLRWPVTPGFPAFDNCDTLESRLNAIQDLKLDENDLFLKAILPTVLNRGLDEDLVIQVLRATIRRRPSDRIKNIQGLVDLLCRESTSNSTDPHVETTLNQGMSEMTVKEGSPAHSTPYAKISLSNVPSYMHEFGDRHIELLQTTNIEPALKVQPSVKQRIMEDYLRIASDMSNGYETRALAAFDYSLRLMFGVHDNVDVVKGLSWLRFAAANGLTTAQAVVYRLHDAFQTPVPADCPVEAWLIAAASAGSLIALSDLELVNHASFSRVVEDQTQRLSWISSSDFLDRVQMRDDTFLSQSDFMRLIQVTNEYQVPDQLRLLVRSCIEQGIFQHVDDKVSIGEPSLDVNLMYILAGVGKPTWAEVLLQSGAEINKIVSEHGETPICCACRSQNPSMVQYLIDQGADLTIQNVRGATFFHYLAFLRDEDAASICRSLSRQTKSALNGSARPYGKKPFLLEDFRYQGTPLHWATNLRRQLLVAALLQQGANPVLHDGIEDLVDHPAVSHFAAVYVKRKYGVQDSALALAVENHQPNMVSQMLRYAQDLTKDDIRFLVNSALARSKMQMMILNGREYRENLVEVIRILRGNDLNPLMDMALATGNDSFVLYLLEHDYPVDMVSHGLPALTRSLIYENGNVSLALLDRGADPSLRPPTGQKWQTRPLSQLAVRGVGTRRLEITTKLIQKGATSKEDPEGHFLLYQRALVDGDIELAEFLVRHDNATAEINEELLGNFMSHNSHEYLAGINYLLDSISSPYLSNGETIFHVICSVEEHIRNDALNAGILQSCLRRFPSSGALDSRDDSSETAMMCAIREGNHYALDHLLRSGASLEAGATGIRKLFLGRLLTSRRSSARFEDLSQESRRARRYEDNSAKMMIIMLRILHPNGNFSNRIALRALQQVLETWRSPEFSLSCVTESLALETQAREDHGTLRSDDSCLEEDKESFLFLSVDMSREGVVNCLWNGVMQQWVTVMEDIAPEQATDTYPLKSSR